MRNTKPVVSALSRYTETTTRTLALRQAVVLEITEPTITIDMGGVIPGVRHLESYIPTVSDVVWVLVNEPDMLVLGNLATGQATGMPAGSMTQFAGSTAPDGWLLCNGTAVSRETYADLFAVIGTTFGAGDGSTTFNLPNAQSKFPVGAGTYPLGSTGGVDQVTLGSTHLPLHGHSISVGSVSHNHTGASGTADAHNHSVPTALAPTAATPFEYVEGGADPGSGRGSVNTGFAGGHSHTVSVGSTSHGHTASASTAGSDPTSPLENRPPYLAVNFIIKY